MIKQLYRVIFLNQTSVYEVYADTISEGGLFGFLEVRDLVFGNATSMIVDPSEERLKKEFEGVSAFYIPVHQVIRVDEVSQRGPAKIRDIKDKNNITPLFPGAPTT